MFVLSRSLVAVVVLFASWSTAWAQLPNGSKLAPYFQPPAESLGDRGDFRSPLKFYDGQMVKSSDDWQRRRAEILAKWHELLGGPWPALLDQPNIARRQTERRENFTQHAVLVDIAQGKKAEGYLLVPDGNGPFPAVLVPFYEARSSAGLGDKGRGEYDFALQLVRRGFVTLAIATPGSVEHPELAGDTRKLLVMAGDEFRRQPLSYLAYVAANCHTALAQQPEVDPKRIGIVGHSYGGKWSMFASCLYDKFACAVWCDPGIGFDETNRNVNYYEPWYIGWEPDEKRKPGVPSADNPRTGLYKQLYEKREHDLLEFTSLMCPRPVLVSGGSEDPPHRWRQLNHLIEVNRVLGVENRVAMTTRPGHNPTPEAVEAIGLFFETFLSQKATIGDRGDAR
jgi:dienelactone hydrolase